MNTAFDFLTLAWPMTPSKGGSHGCLYPRTLAFPSRVSSGFQPATERKAAGHGHSPGKAAPGKHGQGSWAEPLETLGHYSSFLRALQTPVSTPHSEAQLRSTSWVVTAALHPLTPPPPRQVSQKTLLLYENWRSHTAFCVPANCDLHKVYAKREHWLLPGLFMKTL